MSGLWVLEERIRAGEPILDFWEPKSGHFRFRPYTLLWGAAEGTGLIFLFDVVRPRVGAYYILGGCRI